MKWGLVVGIGFGLCISAYGYKEHAQVITQLLDRYEHTNRALTTLEIGLDGIYYSQAIAKNYNVAANILLVHKLCSPDQYACALDTDNITVLNPHDITPTDLHTLGRCEHFDVVMVHGVPFNVKTEHPLKEHWKQTIDELIRLGDYVFIEVPAKSREYTSYIDYRHGDLVSQGAMTNLYLFNVPKKGLDIARWNLHTQPEQDIPRYRIESTFSYKRYFKPRAPEGTDWLKGINLMTFLMLGGIWPSQELICKDIVNMRHTKHNDLIIGNMIVQGAFVVPIDFGDPRWNGNMKKCIDSALAVFGNERFRLTEPQAALNYYRSLMAKKSKRK